MNIKRNVQFQLRAYKGKTTKYQIRMRVTYCGNRFEYATQSILYTPDAWDEERQCVKLNYIGAKNETAKTVNAKIAKYKEVIDECFKYFEVKKVIPSLDELKEMFEKTLNPEEYAESISQTNDTATPPVPQKNIWALFDEFTEERGKKNDWTHATHQKLDSLKRDLMEFNKNLTFDYLTESGLTKFLVYLREVKTYSPPKSKVKEDGTTPGKRTGIQNNTIEKKFIFLKWFMNWATDNGYNTNMAYRTFKPVLKMVNNQIIYLTEEEMKKIRDFELPAEKMYLDRVRDVFRFCCFTGLRYSDVYNLTRANIKGDYIDIVTIKTNDHLQIPLSTSAKAILDKYASVPFEDDKALPVITNQNMNVYIKELCKLAEINTPCTITMLSGNKREDIVIPKHQLISTHAGRRTFVSLALSMGISAEVVMKITGHKSYNTMKPYIAIAKEAKKKAVDVLVGL